MTGTANATLYRAIDGAPHCRGRIAASIRITPSRCALYTSSNSGGGGIGTRCPDWHFCCYLVPSTSGTVTGNTIGATSGGGGASAASLYSATKPPVDPLTSISNANGTAADTVNIQNNTIGSIDAVGTTATVSGGFEALMSQTPLATSRSLTAPLVTATRTTSGPATP